MKKKQVILISLMITILLSFALTVTAVSMSSRSQTNGVSTTQTTPVITSLQIRYSITPSSSSGISEVISSISNEGTVPSGTNVTLTWSSSNTINCKGYDNVMRQTKWSTTNLPTYHPMKYVNDERFEIIKDTTFTLECTNSNGESVTKSVSVNVPSSSFDTSSNSNPNLDSSTISRLASNITCKFKNVEATQWAICAANAAEGGQCEAKSFEGNAKCRFSTMIDYQGRTYIYDARLHEGQEWWPCKVLNNPEITFDGFPKEIEFDCSKQPVNEDSICTDSDGGEDYFTKGVVTSEYCKTHNCVDSCLNNEYASDWYCDKDNTQQNLTKCSNGCKDGTCLIETCIDSDNSKDYSIYILPNAIIPDFNQIDFPDLYNKGKTNSNIEGKEYVENDICNDDYTIVNERFCINGKTFSMGIPCSYGCNDGACLEKPASCSVYNDAPYNLNNCEDNPECRLRINKMAVGLISYSPKCLDKIEGCSNLNKDNCELNSDKCRLSTKLKFRGWWPIVEYKCIELTDVSLENLPYISISNIGLVNVSWNLTDNSVQPQLSYGKTENADDKIINVSDNKLSIGKGTNYPLEYDKKYFLKIVYNNKELYHSDFITPVLGCSKTDKGVYGKVFLKDTRLTDYKDYCLTKAGDYGFPTNQVSCSSDNDNCYTRQYICDDQVLVNWKEYKCENGCNNGVCNPSPATQIITLTKGWNLLGADLTIPFNRESINKLLDCTNQENIVTAWTYNHITQKWYFLAPNITNCEETYAKTREYEPLNNQYLTEHPNAGIWINLKTPTYNFKFIPSNTNNFGTLNNGWNLVAYQGKEEISIRNNLVQQYLNKQQEIITIWNWDHSVNEWGFSAPIKMTTEEETTYRQTGGRNYQPINAVKPGKAYWINIGGYVPDPKPEIGQTPTTITKSCMEWNINECENNGCEICDWHGDGSDMRCVEQGDC